MEVIVPDYIVTFLLNSSDVVVGGYYSACSRR